MWRTLQKLAVMFLPRDARSAKRDVAIVSRPNFHYHEQPFEKLFLHTYCLHTWPVEMYGLRKRTVIRRIFGIRGKTADLS